jgi:hypothetical protein
LIHEPFALADANVQQALSEPVRRLADSFGRRIQKSSLSDFVPNEPRRNFATWADTFCVIQWGKEFFGCMDCRCETRLRRECGR